MLSEIQKGVYSSETKTNIFFSQTLNFKCEYTFYLHSQIQLSDLAFGLWCWKYIEAVHKNTLNLYHTNIVLYQTCNQLSENVSILY